ncbi:unnamed protein product [Symbiodinium sp. CCMP2592]|nr:unnamed protein product [Symbiodinium sp. CCMP2592]
MHLDDPDLLHNINRVIREMGLVGKAVTFRMDQEAALGALAEKLTKCDSSPASATLIDVVPGYRPQSKGSIERQVETMKQGFWSVWLDLEKEVAKVKQETEAVELGKYQLPLGGLLWQACVFYVARCYNLWCTSVGDSSTSIDRLHEEIVNRTRTRPFGCLVQAQVSKSKAHHDKFRGARTVKAVYLGPVHAKGGGIFAVPVGSREIDIFPVARMIQGGDIYDAKTLEELSLAKPLLQDTEDPERPILFDPLEAPGDDAPDEGAGVGMDEDGDEEMIEDELADYSPSEAPENQEVVNDEGDMEIDWLTNHYLESLFRGPDLRATSTAVAKSFDLKFGGTKIRCAVPQNAVSETSGEKLEPDLLYASMKLELEELESFKVGEVIPEREARRLAKENGRRVLTSRWVNTVKKKGLYRSRLVVWDYASMGGTTLSEGIYSPTTSLEGLRLLLSMLCRRGSVLSCDVSVAFMHAPVARAEFVELPNNVSAQVTGERVFVKLRKAMNGLRSAPLSWYCELAEYLRSQNFEASLDPTIFRRLTRKGLTIVLFYVDDLLIYSEDEAEGRRFYEELRKRYKLKITGELIQDCPGEVSFLGRRIFRRKKGERTVYFGLDEQYLSSCCEEYGITKPAPKLPSLERRYAELLKKGQTELISPAAHERYRRTLGRLAWAALSRPDLQFVCGFLGRHQAAPDEAAETCMRDVLRWVKGLPHKVQRFPSKREILEDDADPASVSCFTDASWSLNSVSGGIITWENCSLKSFSRKQTTTALSSAEAELAALTEVAREGLYIALLVETIREGMPKDRETGYYVLKGYSDSESAVCISKMQTLLRKVRHIELRAAFLQELVARGRFTIEHIPGVINPADALTKSPTNESLASLYDASGLVDEPKAWESEPTEVHVSFEEPNENERFTPSVPPSWKASQGTAWFLSLRFTGSSLRASKSPLAESIAGRCSLRQHEVELKGKREVEEPLGCEGLRPLAVDKRHWNEKFVVGLTAGKGLVGGPVGCSLHGLSEVDPPLAECGKVGAVLAGLWKDLPEAAQKAFQEVGYSPPRPKGPPPPPPGLDLQSLLKGRMTEKEYNAARAVVYAGAGLHVQTLLEAAGIPPPPDEDLDQPEPTPQEKLTRCVSDFKKATNQMKNLVEKKAKLQARADKLKQELEKLIGDVDQVDKDIKAKDVEIQETAKAFKEMTADSTSTAFSALEAVLSEAGHEEATRVSEGMTRLPQALGAKIFSNRPVLCLAKALGISPSRGANPVQALAAGLADELRTHNDWSKSEPQALALAEALEGVDEASLGYRVSYEILEAMHAAAFLDDLAAQEHQGCQESVVFVSANITTWTPDILKWHQPQKGPLLIQELHLGDEGADVASLEACVLVLSNRRQQTHKDWCKSVRPPRQSKERKPGKAALALHTVWEKLTPEARLAIEEAGWRPPSAAAVVPPPGLGDFDVDMDASEACEAKQKLWSEATEQQKELMLKAGLKPPEQTPAPTSYEVGTAANAAFRKATVALKLLGDKKISLQKRIDQAKEQYNARLTEMKQLQTKIEEAQQQVADAGEELTTKVLAQDESLNGEIAQFLEKFGISLTEEQEAKIAAVRAGTHGPPDSQAFDLKAAAPNTQEVPKKSEPAQNGVAVRPAGCTQADQVLVHSTWSGSALAQSGDPGVSALWASLLQGLEHMCHVQVLQAVEALEAGQYILEDTFPWFAAELAVEAGDDVPWHVAASAIRDVIANLNSNADGKKLLLVSSNVTKWRKSLATFLAGIRPDLWLVQETHIKEEQGDLLATHVGAFGYQAFSLPGHPTGGGGNSGGLAIVFKKHLDVRKSHHFLHQGVGFQSVVLRIRGVDIFLVNVYLKTGEGFRGPTNAIILSNLIPFLRSLQGEFLVAGDFNEDISVLVTTSLAQEARGQWVHTGASTCTGGGNIDFGLVSKGLALGVSVRADWITPFAPHAALHWCIDRRQCELRFPQLVGFKPMPIMPQPFEPPLAGCSGPQPDLESACAGHWGGSIPEPALTHTFEQLSSSVELSVYGCTQGRGCLPKFRRDKLLRHTSPVGAWGGAQASFWKRVLVWLELSVKRSCPAPFGHTFWSQLELMWHGSTAELSVFQVQLDAVLKGVTPSAFPELIQVSEQQFRHHSKLWMQKQSASYGKWLKQASCKGLRGLFTSVKADEAVQLRPFLHQPVQERIYLRWRQWFELWSAPGGVDPALLSDLRQRARMQAKELGPIPLDQAVAAFKRVPSKAPGLDGWTFEMLKNLQRPAVASIISFLHHCETEATWPAQMVFALIALLPKSEKRERPIALLHVLYRTWVRMRWKLVSDWQFQYCKAAVWDKAMPGSQVLDVALGRLLRGEAARQSGQHLVTIFIDMETFYDRCRFNDVISSGLSLGYPPLVLHQALLTYMGPRFLQSEGSLCPAITPTKGVLAGCPAAPSISKLVVHPIAVAATSKRATSNLDVWIDDLSLDCVGASAKQIASDAVLLFRSLRTSIEATGQWQGV